MGRVRGKLAAIACGCTISALSLPVLAWDLAGKKEIALHTRDGQSIPIGSVTFLPKGDQIGFSLDIDHARFKDFFLSMKEFKCLESSLEILCHVPYPYANPGTVTQADFSWLEHALLFLYKSPTDFGAKLWNGIYYRMVLTDNGLVGTPEAVDLNLISAPSSDASTPPFSPMLRTEITPGSRWIASLTIR